MHILMISWEYPPQVVGGLARHVQELSEALVLRGDTVHVITALSSGLPEYTVQEGVHVHRVQSGYPEPRNFLRSVLNLNFAFLEKAFALVEKVSFDLIHCHDWLGAHTAKVLKEATGLPLISTIHATEAGRNNGLHNDLQRQISDVEWWLTFQSWQVICCSRFMAGELNSFFQLPMDKIEVIPNGVDPKRFKVSAETDLVAYRRRFAAPDEKIVFFIGRLVREKGAQELLYAIPKIRAFYPDVKFLIAGRGPMLEELHKLAYQLRVEDRVQFTGFADDLRRNLLYAISDVAVYPSLYEPFGIVALEAMATGVPTVVSDTGGLAEIVTHGVNGLKAYTGNANSLADNILTLLHRPELGAELSREAFREIRTLYNWQSIAGQTQDLYQRVSSQAKVRSGPSFDFPLSSTEEIPSRYAETKKRQIIT